MRLARTKSTARFSFALRDAIGIGGNAPRDALASDDSRARLLKNPPYETTRVVVSARITVGPAITVRNCIFILFFIFVG
jgi:hypothetical protein